MGGMKAVLQRISIIVTVLALGLFTGGRFSFLEKARAQVTPQNGQSEFKHDVEEGMQQVRNDRDAQNNQQEIDNEDDERAGDEHADVKEVDGENNQDEIDNEIEQEVAQEDATDSQSSGEHGNDDASTSIETGASPDDGARD